MADIQDHQNYDGNDGDYSKEDLPLVHIKLEKDLYVIHHPTKNSGDDEVLKLRKIVPGGSDIGMLSLFTYLQRMVIKIYLSSGTSPRGNNCQERMSPSCSPCLYHKHSCRLSFLRRQEWQDWISTTYRRAMEWIYSCAGH